MNLSKAFAGAAVAVLLSSCASTYQQKALTTPAGKLVQGKTVLIATPENGAYGKESYGSSGASTAQAVKQGFARYTNAVSISSKCRDLSCLKAEASVASDYYVVPTILHWEDRATEWSGKKDKIEIKLTIYDGRDGTEIANQIISGKSKWATFGGDHPEDLLPDPIASFLQSIYQ